MLHLWLVALCVHVVMWSPICPSSHRYHNKTSQRSDFSKPASFAGSLVLVAPNGSLSDVVGSSLFVCHCPSLMVIERDPETVIGKKKYWSGNITGEQRLRVLNVWYVFHHYNLKQWLQQTNAVTLLLLFKSNCTEFNHKLKIIKMWYFHSILI